MLIEIIQGVNTPDDLRLAPKHVLGKFEGVTQVLTRAAAPVGGAEHPILDLTRRISSQARTSSTC